MKILRITVQGLPLFKQELDLVFYTQQRVGEDDKDKLFFLKPNYFLHQAVAFIGINASGKTSVLKAINMALDIINNQPINHSEAKTILGSSQKIAYKIYFFDNDSICCLETIISSKKLKNGVYIYSILEERLWEKPIYAVKSKKYLTDFPFVTVQSLALGLQQKEAARQESS